MKKDELEAQWTVQFQVGKPPQRWEFQDNGDIVGEQGQVGTWSPLEGDYYRVHLKLPGVPTELIVRREGNHLTGYSRGEEVLSAVRISASETKHVVHGVVRGIRISSTFESPEGKDVAREPEKKTPDSGGNFRLTVPDHKVTKWTWAAFQDDGSLLAAFGTGTSQVYLARFLCRQERFQLARSPFSIQPFNEAVCCLTGNRLLTGHRLYDLNNGSVLWSSQLRAELCLCEQGKWFAYMTRSNNESEIGVVDVESGKVLVRLERSSMSGIAVSSTLRLLAVTTGQTTELISVPEGKARLVVSHWVSLNSNLNFNVRHRHLAIGGVRDIGGQRLTVTHIVDLDSGKTIAELNAPSVVFSPDGNRAIAGEEFLSWPDWISHGSLGTDGRFTEAGVLTRKFGQLCLWDLNGELLTSCPFVGVTSCGQTWILGKEAPHNVRMLRRTGDQGAAYRTCLYKGIPLLSKDERWLCTYSPYEDHLEVVPLESIKWEETEAREGISGNEPPRRQEFPVPPSAPSFAPEEITGLWEHYRFDPDGSFFRRSADEQPDGAAWRRAGTWEVKHGTFWVRDDRGYTSHLGRPEPNLLGLFNETLSRLPTARGLWGEWEITGESSLPKLLGFSQRSDKATKNWLVYDASDHSIIGEYSPKGFETTVSLLMSGGDTIKIVLVGPDEFEVVNEKARGIRVSSFSSEPERRLHPEPWRQSTWDTADREYWEAQDRVDRARERNPYLK